LLKNKGAEVAKQTAISSFFLIPSFVAKVYDDVNFYTTIGGKLEIILK